MKLLVVVPSAEALQGAGVRIRYQRLSEPLASHGVKLELLPIDEPALKGRKDVGALLISKVVDSRAAVLAHAYRQRGVRVGVDLFDDYFSQTDRPAFRHLQRWLRQMVPLLDFALCSTQAMAAVARPYIGALPLQWLRDPRDDALAPEPAELARSLTQRASDAASSGVLRVAWFGMGDNPHFDVGLHDLAGGGDHLRALERDGRKVELTVLTNERALTDAGIRLIRQLPVSTRIDLWSEERERKLLLESLLTFIPVAQHGFSRAKSPNRGITALSLGCQVLNTGHSLYGDYSPFVYKNARELTDSLAAQQLKLRPQTLPGLLQLFEAFANPEREAEALAGFLHSLPAPATAKSPLVVLHGISTPGDQHKCCQRHGGYSVASPLARAKLAWDLGFRLEAGASAVVADLSERLVNALPAAAKERVAGPAVLTGNGRCSLPVQDVMGWTGNQAAGELEGLRRALLASSLPEKLVFAQFAMDCSRRVMRSLLPNAVVFANERQPGLDLTS
jgi:hypothetical protein